MRLRRLEGALSPVVSFPRGPKSPIAPGEEEAAQRRRDRDVEDPPASCGRNEQRRVVGEFGESQLACNRL